METKLFDVTDLKCAKAQLAEAASLLRAGGLVAFPTETVYGLGADAMNPKAAEKIYAAKGRPSDNPLIVHIAEEEDLARLTDVVPDAAKKLMKAFWPGPLTMIFQKKGEVPDKTTGGLDTVAVRMPDHPVALALIRQSGCPIAAPSANLSGRPSPTKWEHVYQDLSGAIDVILQGEPCRVGIESTVLDMTGDVPMVLRPGILTPEQIGRVIGREVVLDPALLIHRPRDVSEEAAPAPKAPGMKYKHYAPKAEMVILQGEHSRVKAEIKRMAEEKEKQGIKVGVILFDEDGFERAAHDFFSKLREMDENHVDLILAGALSDKDSVGFAVMNRMWKSAGYHVIHI